MYPVTVQHVFLFDLHQCEVHLDLVDYDLTQFVLKSKAESIINSFSATYNLFLRGMMKNVDINQNNQTKLGPIRRSDLSLTSCLFFCFISLSSVSAAVLLQEVGKLL